MKKLLAILLAAVLLISLCACSKNAKDGEGSEDAESSETGETVLSNDYVTIDGICVDDAYEDEDNSVLKMVYLFYTVNASDENLEADSTYTKLTIGENTYTSERYNDVCLKAPSYYYSDYIEDVYVGSTFKVVTTFKIPEADLEAGKSITLEDSQIPDISDISLSTDDIQHFNGDDSVCEAMDPEGYAEEMYKRETADAETTRKVQNLVNGYYWSFYANYTSYELEFFEGNEFVLSTSLGTSQGGTYTVQNAYIFCTYPTGHTVEIPYEINEAGEIELYCVQAFDVNQ